jgi:probable O-glycosylation ligase (exosortase A-associated)
MRGLLLFTLFVSSLWFVFKSPFNGALLWYVFSLGNFQTITWGFFSEIRYAYIIAIVTCLSWVISKEPKKLPLTPLAVLTLVFAVWITITSVAAVTAAGPASQSFVADVWMMWSRVEKVLFMCLVGYALTTTRERVNQMIWVVVLSIGVWGVKGAIWELFHGGSSRLYGPNGTDIGDNNDFGLALIIIVPLVFYQWQQATNRRLRHGLMAMGFLVSLAVLFTYSRGALVGLCAMGAVFLLRTRAKLATGLMIICFGLFAYSFAPAEWFGRMETIQTYEQDSSAESRIYMWKISLRVAEQYPLLGGGFKVTYSPMMVNPLLRGTDLAELPTSKAPHSIYFEVLSEHSWLGLAFWLMIAAYSWRNCAWLVRHSRDRPDYAWANNLGRMGQASLVAYLAGGAFVSQAYLDEYWCVIFVFDAARRIIAREIASRGGAFAAAVLGVPKLGISTAAPAKSDLGAAGYVRSHS